MPQTTTPSPVTIGGGGTVLAEVHGHTMLVTLNRPDARNAVNNEVMVGVGEALDHAEDNANIWVVIVTGAGDRAFCAGADLTGFSTGETELQRHGERELFVEVFLGAERLGKPLIGCINGHALAGGFGLALGCDLLVAAETATFGTPEVNVGLWPMMVTALTIRNLGRKRAMQLFLTGERIDARTAAEWGLVHRVVSPAEVRTAAHALAVSLTDKSPLITRLGRDAFYGVDGLPFESAQRFHWLVRRERRGVAR